MSLLKKDSIRNKTEKIEYLNGYLRYSRSRGWGKFSSKKKIKEGEAAMVWIWALKDHEGILAWCTERVMRDMMDARIIGRGYEQDRQQGEDWSDEVKKTLSFLQFLVFRKYNLKLEYNGS